jgi:2-keto-4-pentenoate hydratase/2-oxohepta-3-ene-1,7-dioic acid hydratase in catechol pathway
MKLATFSAGGAPEIGVVDGETIRSISRAAPALAQDMIALIAAWPTAEREVRRIAAEAPTIALDQVRLKAPIPRPGKIMAIGLNYADHIAESNMGTPEHQTWFAKAATATNGPFDDVEVPRGSQAVDYEAEMVAIIGKGGRHISRADAPGAVFGLCCGNDVSERAWQLRTTQWVVGKSFDTHAPFGPWITTLDEAADPSGRELRCLVNGEVRQHSNTRHLVFDVWAQVEELSKAMTLETGDVIYTGTPGGVGMAMKPPVFLKAGDVVRVEIEGLGAIENRFTAEA